MRGQDPRRTILVVDDDIAVREALSKILAKEGYRVLTAEDGQAGLALLRREPVHVLLADLKMPKLSGLDLLKAAKAVRPEVEVIVITGYGSIEEAVLAMKEGAYDFITKPFKRVDLDKAIRKALEKQALVVKTRELERELEALQRSSDIIASSPAMHKVLQLVEQVAPSSATILIQGESGTGKELIANAIHRLSHRRDKPFIKVNCAAIPETLLESELFGYEKGAFTGASARKEGRFELADGGTMFLDEVGDLSLATQAKLLRVLQEGEFEHLGGTRTIKVDVRLVAATNKDLVQAVKEKTFREDLFYRLNVIAVSIPPLRERREDIPLLAHHFLRTYARKNEKEVEGFSKEALDLLIEYPWPGNVRELENAIERAVVLARGKVITLLDLPETVHPAKAGERVIAIPIGTPLEEAERQLIQETLQHARGDKALAAKILGIASRTIYRKLGGKPAQLDKMSGEEPM